MRITLGRCGEERDSLNIRPKVPAVAALPVFVRDRMQIIEHTARFLAPAIYEWRDDVEDGGLMAYATKLTALPQRITDYIDRIFEGPSSSQIRPTSALKSAVGGREQYGPWRKMSLMAHTGHRTGHCGLIATDHS